MSTALIPTVYFFYRLHDKQFLDSTMGNWFATIVGIIIGIPIALEINRRQQKTQERREQLVLGEEKGRRENKILILIKGELEVNRQILETLVEEQKTKPRTIVITGLKDALWTALSNSGDLQWVDELDLLSSISYSYYFIRALIHLEKQYDDPNFFLAVSLTSGTGPDHKYAGEKTVEKVLSIRPDALKLIDQSIKAIDNYLAKNVQVS